MQATIELSLYPLHEDYKTSIQEFIDALQSHEELRVETNGMSTQIFGEYDQIMDVVKNEYRDILENEEAILILKAGKGVLRYNG